MCQRTAKPVKNARKHLSMPQKKSSDAVYANNRRSKRSKQQKANRYLKEINLIVNFLKNRGAIYKNCIGYSWSPGTQQVWKYIHPGHL